jgi:hypothetical protein
MEQKRQNRFNKSNIVTSVNYIEVLQGFGCLMVIEPLNKPEKDVIFVSRKPSSGEIKKEDKSPSIDGKYIIYEF